MRHLIDRVVSKMRGFKEAAEFIGQWIKVQKHNAMVRNAMR